MPKIIIPVPKQMEGEDLSNAPFTDPGVRTVYFPANEEILEAIELGQEVKLKIVGKIRTKEAREQEMGAEPFQEFGVELREVDVYSDNEYEKMAREDEED